MEACEANGIQFIELPVAYDGLAVVVSTSNDFVDYLTVAELKRIWEPEAQDKIKSWRQVRSTFPDLPLNLYGPGTASGTFDYFTEAIVGRSKASRGTIPPAKTTTYWCKVLQGTGVLWGILVWLTMSIIRKD